MLITFLDYSTYSACRLLLESNTRLLSQCSIILMYLSHYLIILMYLSHVDW